MHALTKPRFLDPHGRARKRHSFEEQRCGTHSGCRIFAPQNHATFGLRKWAQKLGLKVFQYANRVRSQLCNILTKETSLMNKQHQAGQVSDDSQIGMAASGV